jgi:hypothetical protein
MWNLLDGRVVVSGCVHVHTRYSDGSGDVETVAAAANAAGLDYVIITDHMDLRAREQRGRYGGVQVFAGYEHHDIRSHNHYLALGIRRVLASEEPASQVPRVVQDLGGVGIIAHPEERRSAFAEFPPYPWTAWDSHQFDGIEIWNQMSEWIEHLTPWNRFLRVWSPRKALLGPSERLLYLWDVLNLSRPVAGIAGVDAHAYPYSVGPLTVPIFPYKVHFRTLQTHFILEHEPPEDTDRFEQMVLSALRRCRVFFSSERWGATRGFSLTVEHAGRQSGIGDRIVRNGRVMLHARWPQTAHYRLHHNGFPLARGRGRELTLALDRSGVYRLALYRRGKGWLFTNHVRLVDA